MDPTTSIEDGGPADLLVLADALEQAADLAGALHAFGAWLLRRVSAGELLVLRSRAGGRLDPELVIDTHDVRPAPGTLPRLPLAVLVDAARHGRTVAVQGRGSGVLLAVPTGTPADYMFVVRGLADAPSRDRLHFAR